MSVSRPRCRALAAVTVTAASLVLATPGTARADRGHRHHGKLAVTQVNLISDLSTVGAAVVDPDVVNPWGLALSPTSPLWSANNGTNSATLYTSAPGSTTAALISNVRVGVPAPTGQVFNPTGGFVTTNPGNGGSGPARFIFSTLTGQIAAWAPPPLVGPAQGPAQIPVTTPGAVYTGLALAIAKAGPQLYAANFAQGTVDVFDAAFAPVTLPANRFHDRKLPAGYAPFGIQMLRGHVFVAYAKVNPVTHRNAVGVGLGFVDEYSPEGRLLERVASRHTLNAPWGMEIAPASWGKKLAGSLLIGNFGDGRINVIEAEDDGEFDGDFEGQLTDSSTGKTLVIPGLWALLRGTDPVPATPTAPASTGTGGADSIWFSAGIEDEQHGLIGVLRSPKLH
ncbi:MAG: hypothetical protein QOF87_712 [Pseudonocardiales bacterium]|jgi:uncharacterized protein (TIGR03118 family)|nr:hypothetical protein [Pseudonocardiales bacterium]